MIDDEGMLFPGKDVDPRDARMILHPPGYSILLAAIYGGQTPGETYRSLRLIQIICDSGAAVAILLIAAELFRLSVAAIAGSLVALSPHLAHYSLWLSPDTLAVLPALAAILFIIKASKRPRLGYVIGAGCALGLSCWLRSNGLMLAVFLVPVILLLFKREKRIRYSIAFTCAMLAVIAPITIRNWAVYHSIIPLSLGAGITLIEGIADYDKEGRFGMPATDKETALKDAEWHSRDEYAINLWVPDGLERDRARFARGVAVMRANPGWFVGVMFRRAASMLRYNDSLSDDSIANIGGRVPVVSAEPPFAHKPDVSYDAQMVWASDPEKTMSEGTLISPRAAGSLSVDGQMLQVRGDGSGFGDQFMSAPVSVEKNMDYVLWLRVKAERGKAAVKVTSADRRIALAAITVAAPGDGPKRGSRTKAEPEAAKDSTEANALAPDEASNQGASVLQMPFASGNRREVRLVISNNETDSATPVVGLGEARLFSLGATPGVWSRAVRLPVRGIQKYLFTTFRMLALVVLGIALIALARRSRALLILLAVPAYYLSVQSAFHTEYRYILAIHYFFFVIAAATIYCAGAMAAQAAALVKRATSMRFKV